MLAFAYRIPSGNRRACAKTRTPLRKTQRAPQNANLKKLARPEGLEPPTLCFEGRCSIQLSYGRTVQSILQSSMYSYFFEYFISNVRCNRCNNALFGRALGKFEAKSNRLCLR